MEVLSQNCSVWISYLEEGEGRHGFECEYVWLIDESRNTSPSNPILDDIENYDDMTEPSGKQKDHDRRWKKLLRAVLPAARRKRAATPKGKNAKKEDCASDTSTATTASSLSVGSRASLEGFVITTSKAFEEGTREMLDPNILELLCEIGLDERRAQDELGSEEFEMQKAHDVAFDEATACTVRSESSSLSSHSGTTRDKLEPSLMERRLLDTGLVKRSDFDFVADYVSKEVLHLAEEKKDDEYDPTQDENVAHVKTGIWEVTCLEDDGTPKSPYYIVTGVSMDDRVDTKKLRKSIFANQIHTRRPKLAMAPTEIAEGLAGYKSGTMAPICHTEKMRLFLEESLVTDVNPETRHLNVGSGMSGRCLSISVKHFLEIAKSNPKGLEICPIIRKSKP